MIIAVDFDDTLIVGSRPNEVLLRAMQERQRQGDIVILWTCRHGQRLKEAVQWCHKHGFMPNGINQNAPEIIRRLGHDPRKIYADVYIDDKNMPVPK